VTDFLWLTRKYRESNSSSIAAAFQLIRRQPWKALASGTWNITRRFLQITLVAASLGSLFPLAAHAQSYKAVDADIPFKFNIGNQPFSAGRYQLVFSGPGLLTLRDAHHNAVASFFARYIPSGDRVPTSKLTFKLLDQRPQLDQIWIENTEKLEVAGGRNTSRRSNPSQKPPSNVESSQDTRSISGSTN
jgi:hypothetical protein